jgi:chemotaxis protein CheD
MKAAIPHVRQVHLNPGELILTAEPLQVITVLGSCVAVTLFAPRTGFAGICHAMLPRPKGRTRLGPEDPERFRYLSEVIPAMAARFRNAGMRPAEIEVKLFGGGNVIRVEEALEGKGLGHVNVDVARELLDQESLLVRAANVGGTRGRKIIFNTATGEVLHKHLVA